MSSISRWRDPILALKVYSATFSLNYLSPILEISAPYTILQMNLNFNLKYWNCLWMLHDLNLKVLLGVAIPTLALSGLLLVAFAYLAWNQASRPHLNRVSFRLLVYAIISNIVYGLMLLVNNQNMMGHAACSFVAFLTLTSTLFSASMFCCMALNLQLVLVYNVNGKKMEKYYTIGSLFICVVCGASAWIAGELGWYAASGICWLRDTTPGVQLRWLVGTQLVWRILMSSIDVLSFAAILIFMVRSDVRFFPPMFPLSRISISHLRDPDADSATSEAYRLDTASPLSILLGLTAGFDSGLYPLLSCFMSITTCLLDVYTIQTRVLTESSFRLCILDVLMHPLRPALYALLAATDPSFLAALRALRPTSSSAQNKSTSTMIELPPLELDLESRSDKLSTTRRPSTTEEAAEEIRVESIGHQI
ncbi:hypothetical protein FB451DRAFT_1486089 [Mycena latifolia]|nr:hypothetical protein FB451DRAFT_1486089 [Mycena latifolia]